MSRLLLRLARTTLRNSAACLSAAALLLGASSPALAIPSPELVVGSFSSISQIIALISAMVGGGAALASARVSGGGTASAASIRRAWRIVAVAVAVATVAVVANIYQYTSHAREKQERLEATMTKPSPTVDGKFLDPTLKETSYGDQLRAPHGMSTDEVEKLLKEKLRGEHKDTVFIDIRETTETEMGTLPSATHIRFPDLPKANLDLAGKTAVFLCHNGNRSYETCEALKARGIDCRFIKGGLEKWLVEGRTLTGLQARTLDDLRAIPKHRNQGVLLDTKEVHRLVDEEGAIFLDLRYPGEFATGHIEGAYNITIRPTPSDELRAKIDALPRKPIIIPCYDRRTCFFGDIMGVELERAGHDLRGRYTVPWEYFTPIKPRPYLQTWLDQLNQTWWDKAILVVAGAVRAAADHIGFIAAIFLLAALSRLLVLPVSLKAERDQIRSRALQDEVEAMKARLAGDPKRHARAMRAFYRRHGLTPVRNLLGLLFLPLMAVSVAAVHAAATTLDSPLLWVADAAERDPTFVLAIVFAVLICLYIDRAFARTRRSRLLIWGIGIPALVATGALLSAAADLYMIFSAALLLVQRFGVDGAFASLTEAARKRLRGDGAIPLSEVASLAGCGNKIYRLAQLQAHAIPVPDGVVLTSRHLERLAGASPDQRERMLDHLWRRIGAERVVVRSSAVAEDSGTHSFAGVFESVLDVDRSRLDAAIDSVSSSFRSARAQGYGVDGGQGNVLVQRMIPAEYAGVLFTRDPTSAGLALVEMVSGTADKLVSGTVAPQAYHFGRLSARSIGEAKPPIDLVPLIEIGQRIERIFGAPQDIEWTYHSGGFHIVQSRDITRLLHDDSADAQRQAEWQRIIDRARGSAPEQIVYAQNELSELLPRPTPLSLSLVESLWASGGSVDLACRSLGLRYGVEEDSPSYLVTIFGGLYVDKREEAIRAPKLNPLVSRRLSTGATRIEKNFRETFLPGFLKDVSLLEAIDFDRLSTPDLLEMVESIRSRFVTQTYVEVDVINIAADFYMQRAKALLAEAGLDPVRYLTHGHKTVFNRAITDAQASPPTRRDILVRELGHRAALDYELAQPRYREQGKDIEALIELPHPPSTGSTAADIELAGMPNAERISAAVRRAHAFETLKEDAKHHSLRQVAVLRSAVLAADRRFDFGGLVFYLTFEDVAELPHSADRLREVAEDRRARAALFADMPSLEAQLTLVDVEDAAAGLAATGRAEGAIAGTRVSGTGIAEGRAIVVAPHEAEAGAPILGFEDGDIVVSRMVSPAWIPYFRRAGGFICEVGGWLSHTAIVARECNVPLIVSTKGMRAIETGMRLRLHSDGTVEILSELAAAIAAE